MEKRFCNKCLIEKDLETNFKKRGDWYYLTCRRCLYDQHKIYYQQNKEKLLEQAKQRYQENKPDEIKKQKIKEYQKEWYAKNEQKTKTTSKNYYERNKERLRPIRKKWEQLNIEKRRKRKNKKRYKRKTPLPLNYHKEYSAKFRKTPLGMLTNRIHSMLHKILKNKTDSSKSLLRWNKKEFLEKIGEPKKGYHIDHKIPVSWFKLETPVYIICNLQNLQIIEGLLNLSKKNYRCDEISQEYFEMIKDYIKQERINNIKIK